MKQPPQMQEKPSPSLFGRNWNLICVYGCLLWIVFATVVFWGTLDNMDFDGATKEAYKPYETLIGVAVYMALAAMPVGFVLGLFGCFSRPLCRRLQFLLPTATLFLVLALFVGWQVNLSLNFGSETPPTVEVTDEKLTISGKN